MPARGGMGRPMGRAIGQRPRQRMTPQAQAAGGRGQQTPQAALQAQRTAAPGKQTTDLTGMESARQAAQGFAGAMAPQSQVTGRQMSPQAATALAALRPQPAPAAAGNMAGFASGLAGRAGMPMQAGSTPFSAMAPSNAMGQAAAMRGGAAMPPTATPPGPGMRPAPQATQMIGDPRQRMV